MLHHVSVNVQDYEKSKAFYERALAPLGIKVVFEVPKLAAGFGTEAPEFWIGLADEQHARTVSSHIAFAATSEDQVKAFYEAAIAAGGSDNGAPGPRPDYGPDYYGAFVRDIDGNNIEAVVQR